MKESDFRQKVDALLAERANDRLHILDLGRRFKELCGEYLQDHDSLPAGFDFEDY